MRVRRKRPPSCPACGGGGSLRIRSETEGATVGSIWIPAFAGKVGFMEEWWRLITTLG
jgi:hypothetical protein